MLRTSKQLLLFILFAFFIALPNSILAMDGHSPADAGMPAAHDKMFMVGSFELVSNGKPLVGAEVTMRNQTRVTNEKGIVQYDDVHAGTTVLDVRYEGKEQSIRVDVTEDRTLVNVSNLWSPKLQSSPLVDSEQAQAGNLLVSMVVVLVSFGMAMYLIRKRDMLVHKKGKKHTRKPRRMVIASFLIAGTIAGGAMTYQLVNLASGGTQALIGNTMAAEMSTIPTPLNVKAFGDDRVATIQWNKPNNADSKNVIGYVVRWGKKSGGTMTDSRQTIYTQLQIQPIDNNEEYMVSVQSVTGSIKQSVQKNGITYQGEYAVTDGNYSPPVQVSVTGTTERVNAMRTRLTGFFDDFNLPAGNFDERKWNTAYTGCADPGENGAFINSQFHAHNQVRARSDYVDSLSDLPYCDRSASASRPRAVFDVTGATKTNPALIEMDVDGATRNRDIWYIDLIPTTARANGVPVDLEGHDDFFQADTQEPGSILRITQMNSEISFHTWDANRNPKRLDLTYSCQGWLDGKADLYWCDQNGNKVKTSKYSPYPQADSTLYAIPNVRRHWVIEYSPTEISLFINGIKIASAVPPAYVASVNKFQVTSEIFSYTTGKDYDFMSPKIQPQTTLMHWDNFGFSGPAPTTVVHNYIDGGSTGTIPQIATGRIEYPFQKGNRLAKVNIPDQIGSPVKARLMFTINPLGNYSYSWSSSDSVTVNGKKYLFPNPDDNVPGPALGVVASSYTPHSTGILLNPTDLKTGMNDIQLGLNSDITNLHIELEYTKGTEPNYTQPQNVFNQVSYNTFIIPQMRFNDSYLFIEQDMGLSFGATTPQPTTAITVTQAPTLTLAPTVRPTSTPVVTAAPTATPFPTATRAPTPTTGPTSQPTVTQAPTPTNVISGANTIGNTVIGSLTDSSNSNYINSLKVVMGSSPKTVKSISVYVGQTDNSPNNKFQVAIYKDNNGKPGALLGKSSAGNLVANSWNTISISANLEANKVYWLAYNTNGTNTSVNNMKYSPGGVDAYTKSRRSYGSWPTNFGTSVVGSSNFSIYATFE